MDCKYPHWYHDQEKMEPCCDGMEEEMYEPMPGKVLAFPDSHFKDRLMCLLGDEVLFSVDAKFCSRESQLIKML